jgi:D-alanyl-D-alanine dipeptidase
MPGLVPGVHALCAMIENVDGRDKPGHDEAGHTLKILV